MYRYLIAEYSHFLRPIPYNIGFHFTYPQAILSECIFAIIILNRLLTVWSINKKNKDFILPSFKLVGFFFQHFKYFISLSSCLYGFRGEIQYTFYLCYCKGKLFFFLLASIKIFFLSWILSSLNVIYLGVDVLIFILLYLL